MLEDISTEYHFPKNLMMLPERENVSSTMILLMLPLTMHSTNKVQITPGVLDGDWIQNGM